jgi:transposase
MLAFCEDDGLIACWLPPYCSDLNPIERFWEHLKAFACANKLFAFISELVASARRCLCNQNDFASPDRFLFLNTS